MYVRTKTTPNSPRKSVQICETYRQDGKVKQRIVHYVGIALDEKEEEKLKDYAVELMAKIALKREKESKQRSLRPIDEENFKACYRKKYGKVGRSKKKRIEDILPPSQVTLDDIVEESRVIEGVQEIAGAMFDDLYAQLPLPKRTLALIKNLILIRLIEPASKLKSQELLEKKFGKTHQIDAIYRSMDKLFPQIDVVKQTTFRRTQALFPKGIDLLLFDVTTLYFESNNTDELRRYGYSKDHRFNTTQIVLALATNQDGLPVGYELFEGSKAEVSTLISAISHWKQLFDIQSVCFVGDRAMMSKNNLALLEASGYQYIIAAKLRNLPTNLQEKILDQEHYKPATMGNHLAWVGEFEHNKQRLIVSYKKQRATKDAKDRQKIIDKIQKKLNNTRSTKQFISNQGIKKYTKSSQSRTELCEDKIAKDAAWDGLHGVITNISKKLDHPDTLAPAIIARYSNLWRIEESFRINKHTLKMRPIFHWKPDRIHAHIAICYMCFAVLRHLQYRVNLTQKISIHKILESLVDVQASIYIHKDTGDRYKVPGRFSNNARKIYKTLGIIRSLDAEIYCP